MERKPAALTACLLLAVATSTSAGCVRSVEARGERWWEARTEHVHLETDTGRERAAEAAEQLEDLHRALTLAFYRCAERDQSAIEVTLLSREDEYLELAPDTAGVYLHGTDGVLVLPPRVLTADVGLDERTAVFAHELTHRFVRACFPNAPVWLHEGLAKVFETVRIRFGRVVVGRPAYRFTDSPYTELRWEDGATQAYFPRSALPDATTLVSMPRAAFYSGALRMLPGDTHVSVRTANYAAGWALVHLLAMGPDPALRSRFRAYLGSLEASPEPRAGTFAAAFAGVDLDRRLAAYAQAGRFASTTRPWSRGPRIEPRMRAVPGPEAQLRLAELRLATRPTVRALPTVLAHLALARRDPTLRARASLVEAALEPEKAVLHVREARELAPDDVDVQRASALIALDRRDLATAGAAARALAQRGDLRAVDLVVLAAIERESGQLDPALEHARAAVESDRLSPSTWDELARVLQARGQTAEAASAWRTGANLVGRE